MAIYVMARMRDIDGEVGGDDIDIVLDKDFFSL
jgi:hypothetical protein